MEIVFISCCLFFEFIIVLKSDLSEDGNEDANNKADRLNTLALKSDLSEDGKLLHQLYHLLCCTVKIRPLGGWKNS